MVKIRLILAGLIALASFSAGVQTTSAQQVENGMLRIGGFRCASLKKFGNYPTFDLNKIGDWNATSFRQDVWRKFGVPYWYAKGAGAVRVAGPGWSPATGTDISSVEAGGRASDETAAASAASQQEAGPQKTDTIDNINDGDNSTVWSPAEGKRSAKIVIRFASPARVTMIRFLSNDTPERAPRDYSLGLILPDGSRKEIASVTGEHGIGGAWREFPVPQIEAAGVYMDIHSTLDGKQSPAIHELEAKGSFLSPPRFTPLPSSVVIPMGGYAGSDLHFIGNVGEGFPETPDVETPVGEYLVHYENGQTESIPLIAGRNVASMRYGHFVPDAQFAYGFKPHGPIPGELAYHLNEMMAVEVEDQLMSFSYHLEHPDLPILSVEFRCTRPGTMLLLAGVTLQQSGPRINPLFYNGRMIRPYPADTPPAKPSPLDALKDPSREISLDGDWRYATDPGNDGMRREYFSPSYDASPWKTMAVPSQWFTKGLDYHGVVWFRRQIEVPASFPGSVAELAFGAVDYDARIWVNGIYVGRHIGASTAFKVDVTRALHKGASNLVVVRVDSPIDPGYEGDKTLIEGNSVDDIIIPFGQEGSMGGIYRPVFLEARGDVGIANLWAISKISEDLKHAEVQVRLTLENSASAGTVNVTATLLEPTRPKIKPRTFTASSTIHPEGTQTQVELPLSVDNPLLWYPWEQGTPYLHILRVDVRRNGQLLDRQFIRVGLREVDFDRKHLYVLVNHHRVFLKGMVNDDIRWTSLMGRTGYAQRIKMQKDANFNVIRLIGHQSSPDFYDLCDEMGMMVWQEMPLQWKYSHAEAIRQDIVKIVRETIDETRTHASVVGWSAWNEGGQPDFSNRITALMEKEDGTRPVSLSSGRGESIHIYPTSFQRNLYRRTPMWAGFSLNFVSETGAYGMASEKWLHKIAGDDFLQFDSADPLWDNFNVYRGVDGPNFLDAPDPAEWPKEKIRQYILAKIKLNERWFAHYQQFQYENARAQRFAPSTSLINCRFDDAFPLGYSGSVVEFDGQPKPAYYAAQNANRTVLPILFFDFHGAKDIRVVNGYWFRSWKGAKLTYRLTSRDGKVLRDATRTFDLPQDSVVSVFNRDETGDVWHVPGGFFADLTVRDSKGSILSQNHYDFTEEEVHTFVTSVYPLAPVKPINAVVVTADDAASVRNVEKQAGNTGTYSRELLRTIPGGANPEIEFSVNLPRDSNYYIRVSANSGKAAHAMELLVDGKKAEPESYAGLDADGHLTRDDYSTPPISWYPGWHMRLSQGSHRLVFRVPDGQPIPDLTLDAVSLQTYQPMPNTSWAAAFAETAVPNGGTQ